MKRHRLIPVGFKIAVVAFYALLILTIAFDVPDWTHYLVLFLLGVGTVIGVIVQWRKTPPDSSPWMARGAVRRYRLIQVALCVVLGAFFALIILSNVVDLPDWASSLAFPLLVLGVVLSVADGMLRPKPEPDRCPECGYQLAGLRPKAGVVRCPECNAASEPTPREPGTTDVHISPDDERANPLKKPDAPE